MQEQIDKTADSEADMQNCIEELEDCNSDQSAELKAALKNKRAAVKSTCYAKALAKSRLKKWHDERNLNRILQDKLVHQQNIAKEAKYFLAKYQSLMMRSEVNTRKMKKEWSSTAATRSRRDRCR